MPNGDVVICDSVHNSVRRIDDKTLTIISGHTMPVAPFDVAAMDGNTVIVTLPSQKKLQVVQVLPTFRLGMKINIAKSYVSYTQL